jgi:uncharacterized protein (DUF433 family)
MDRVTINPRHRWGTPCIGDTGISVGHIVELHRAGHPTEEILDACPQLDADDIEAALRWHRDHGDAALGPHPPTPVGHPRISVRPEVQGGLPAIGGTRITVDAVLGMWEHGFTVSQILDEYPALTAADIAAALAYDAEVAG